MDTSIRQIIIVGGGTAGWLSAVFLDAALNRHEDNQTDDPQKRCQITLIESAAVNTVGVGEATVPTLRHIMAFLGLDESDWMAYCQATFKLAIKFIDWSGRPGQDIFWHPFDQLPELRSLGLWHHWLQRKLAGHTETFDHSAYSVLSLCEEYKAPKLFTDPAYEGQVKYAYHLDAVLLGQYLRDKAKERGVKHLVDHVVDVALDDRGYIQHLQTEAQGKLAGDLFIDCTGFRGLLINQALEEPFISYADSLLCDKAIALAIPRPENEQAIAPYTTATALEAGWAWHVPLYHRSGHGYVYSSHFASAAEAEATIRAHLGQAATDCELRHLSMRVGHTRNAWVKNCVSIGLSGGFIEPLESTGIYFIEMALQHLYFCFPDKQFDPELMTRYNRLMAAEYETIRDFIILHYCLTQRTDTPFWRANQNLTLPDSLRAKLELWRQVMPLPDDLPQTGLFRDPSYACLLSGMGHLPLKLHPILAYRDDGQAEALFREIKEQAAKLSRTLSDHYQTLGWLQLYNALKQAHRADQAENDPATT